LGTEDLVVDILDVSGGDLATAPILGTVSINGGDLGPFVNTLDLNSVTGTFIDLSGPGIKIAAGDALAVRLSSDIVLPDLYGVKIAWNDPYAAGGFFVDDQFFSISNVGTDMAFKTFVDPVPEPSGLALLGIGVVAILGYGMRKQRYATPPTGSAPS
jgi:hypothetical protein